MALVPYHRYSPLLGRSHTLDLVDDLLDNVFDPFDGIQTLSENTLAVDVHSDDDNVIVQTAVPGIPEEALRVEVDDNNVLTISGESRRQSDENRFGWHVRELNYGRFERRVRLPEQVRVDKADATLENGILTVRLPRTHPGPIKRLAVKARKLLTGERA